MSKQKHFILKILITIVLCAWVNGVWAHHRDSVTVKNVEFVKNCNQWEPQVLFKAALHGGAVFAEKGCFTFVILDPLQLEAFYAGKFDPAHATNGIINAAAYKIHFTHASPQAEVVGQDKIQSYHNYYLGKDSQRWATHVPVFHEVAYKNLYQGIDLLLTQEDFHLKYEFTVAPGASPDQITLDYEGVQSLSVVKGDLVITTAVMQILELKPVAYQTDKHGRRRPVECAYKVNRHQLTFELGAYDPSLPLIIDPVLIFSSYSGSTADNWGYSATYDKEGNLYSGGNIFGVGYPTVTGSFQVNFAGGSTDIAISKFDTGGSFLHFSTYLGGSGTEVPHSLIVNDNDELYVLGTTSSDDFPCTEDAFDTTFNGGTNYTLTSTVHFDDGSDIIIAKFNDAGTQLLASTYIGGTSNDGLNTVSTLRKNYADEVRGEIIIDEQSNVYVASCTQSHDFPATFNTFNNVFNGGNQDGVLFKFSHDLAHLIWGSYLGGTGDDAAYSLVLASDNSLYVCGGTTSADLGTSPTAVQPTYGGGANDGFILHVSPNGNQLLQASYLGKEGYDQTYLVKKDRYDNPHLFGQTNATGNAWIQNAGWYVTSGGQFLTKLTPTLDSVIWSTAFGTGNGGLDISPTALLVDLCNNIYMSGWGSPITNGGLGGTAGLPITSDAFQMTTDNNDYYFICISDDASQLVYATYFGSPNAREHVDGGTSRFDNHGRIYQAVCSGCGGYDDFPTTPGAWSEVNNSSNCNIGVIKFDFNLPAVVADFNIPNTVCAPLSLEFQNTSQRISDSTQFFWDFGDGTTSTQENPFHYYSESGTYTITLVAQDVGSCNFSDTLTRQLVVLSNSNSTLANAGICNGDFVQIGIAPSGNPDISYEWWPQNGLSNPFISNPIADPTATTTYMLFITDGVCIDTITQTVTVENLTVDAGEDRTICLGTSALIVPSTSSPGRQYYWSLTSDFSSHINPNINSPSILVSPTQTTTYYLRVVGEYCEAVDEVTVYVSDFSIETPGNYVVCYEDSLQIVTVIAEQGEYTYQWSPSESIVAGGQSDSPWVRPLENTTYTVTATNEYGCTASLQIPVQIKRYQSNPIVTDALCNGSHDGSITLNVSGGEEPYFYNWSNGATSSTTTQLHAGTYTVTVTDNTGCKGIDSLTVSEPAPLNIALLNSQNVACDQLCDGILQVQANGGTAPYTYSWLHGATGSNLSNLCAGIYTVRVEDAHHCPISAIFEIEDTAYSLPYQISQISCTGNCDGAIYLSPNFNGFDHQIIWNQDESLDSDTLTDLCAGNYFATVSIENGCTYQLYFQIEERDALEFLHIFPISPSCYGDLNGSLQVVMVGGEQPYTYYLNNTVVAMPLENLAPGSYPISVVDANDCRVDTTIVILQPALLEVAETHVSPPCPEVCRGEIRLNTQGGTIPYRYAWNNASTQAQIGELCAGTYSVTVTDRNNCTTTLEIVLTDSSLFNQEVEAWTDVDTLYAGETTHLFSTDLGDDFSYQWNPSGSVAKPNEPVTDATPLSTTDYVIVVTDEYGCRKTDTVHIFVRDVICEEPYVFVPNAFSPNGDGKNDVLYVRGEVITSVKFEVFDRWGEKVFSTTSLADGWNGIFRGEPCEPGVYDYYLEVTCMGQKQFFKKGNVTLLR